MWKGSAEKETQPWQPPQNPSPQFHLRQKKQMNVNSGIVHKMPDRHSSKLL